LRIADEDSVSLEDRRGRRRPGRDQLDIVVVRLPRISNYDDVGPLEHEPGVVVRFVGCPEEVTGADLVILPGSKNTASDLEWLRNTGIATVVEERAANGLPVLGICGGCQMLGELIEDPYRVESPSRCVPGLGLLKLRTRFEPVKITAQVRARRAGESFLTVALAPHDEISSYEIHMGLVEHTGPSTSPFEIVSRNGRAESVIDGAIDQTGAVVGTMLHGLFENVAVRDSLLQSLRARKGLAKRVADRSTPPRDAEYDRLAAVVSENIDTELLWRISGVRTPTLR